MSTAILTLLLGCVVILATICANGYFVAQEFAYMSADRSKLRALAHSGDERAARALDVTRRTSFMLSGAQLGITVTGLIVGYVAEPLVGESLGVILGGAGVPSAVSVGVGTVGALVVAAIVQMIIGELFPKNYAIANPIPLALGMARSTKIYLAIFGWLIHFFDFSANALLRLLGIEPVHDVDSSATAEDLDHIVTDSHVTGDLPDELFLALDRVLDFPDRDVEHAMIPRSRAGTVQPRTTLGEVRTLMASEHTRYPVIDEGDEPVGVVHLLDVMASTADPETEVETLMRPPLIVPTVMRLPDALAALQESEERLACVIDEYGGFVGVLTWEDLAEEIFGEITDEHDLDDPAVIVETGDEQWRLDAELPIDEVEREIGHDLPPGDYETFAGLLLATRGGLLEAGEVVRIDLTPPSMPGEEDEQERSIEVTVLNLEHHVPDQVSLRVVTKADGADDRARAEDSESGEGPEHGPADPGRADDAGPGRGEES